MLEESEEIVISCYNPECIDGRNKTVFSCALLSLPQICMFCVEDLTDFQLHVLLLFWKLSV